MAARGIDTCVTAVHGPSAESIDRAHGVQFHFAKDNTVSSVPLGEWIGAGDCFASFAQHDDVAALEIGEQAGNDLVFRITEAGRDVLATFGGC